MTDTLTDVTPMTRSEAAEYAPQWGSLITSGDPGACMYGLDSRGRPSDAVTRDLMLAHIDSDCLPAAEGDDVAELARLKAYLAPLTFPEPAPPYVFDDAPAGGHDVAEFARHYVTALLWSTTDPDDEDSPLDSKFGPQDLAPEAWASIESDCREFLTSAGHLVTAQNYTGNGSGALQMAGHDFWLTRVGHGAGFWDGDWKSDARQGLEGPLTVAAGAFGDCDPYVGDDGRIHLS